MSIIFYTNHK